mmetsp:Transcript_56021/g.103661  ORF Transcript_56021/g.103661 Transcript_56021/m.103661 type:complete len:316 (-) Transcript_56021:142-1089(-)
MAAVPVEHLRQENGKLKSENNRLLSEIAAARPDSKPATPEVDDTPGSSADRLVHLMSEGAKLLQEREALKKENDELLDGLGQPQGTDPAGAQDLNVGGVDDGNAELGYDDDLDLSGVDVDLMQHLLPLLKEGEALRAERIQLRTERQDILGSLEGKAALPQPAQVSTQLSKEEAELEARLKSTMKDVVQENKILQAEIDKLREENGRLRTEAGSLADGRLKEFTIKPPSRVSSAARKPRPHVEMQREMSDERRSRLEQQREAMSALLSQFASLPDPKLKYTLDGDRSSNPKRPATGDRKEQIRGAMHSLYRSTEK